MENTCGMNPYDYALPGGDSPQAENTTDNKDNPTSRTTQLYPQYLVDVDTEESIIVRGVRFLEFWSRTSG